MKNQYEIDYQQGYDSANGKWLERIDKIKAEIDKQYMWLINTRYTIRDVDIAFDSIFRFINKYKAEREDGK